LIKKISIFGKKNIRICLAYDTGATTSDKATNDPATCDPAKSDPATSDPVVT